MSQIYRTAAQNDDFPLSRRTMLKGTALTAGAFAVGGGFGAFGFSGSARASSHTSEVLYLVDNSNPFGGATSMLYSVELVDGSSPVAELTPLGSFDDTDSGVTYTSSHIACTPDGSTIYAVNEGQAFGPGIRLGAWDVGTGTFTDIGPITGVESDARLTQAAISPDGKLYLVDVVNDLLYEIQDYETTPSAGPGLSVGVNLQGGDIVFDSDGTLYCYSLSPQQLLVIDPTSGVVVDQIGTSIQSFTGLAIRDAGEGVLVGSRNKSSSPDPNSVIELDPSDGSVQTVYAMTLDGEPFAHTFGDMSVGPLDIEPECLDCDTDELLAKYEFACVETNEDDECVVYDFVLETGDESLVTYEPGSFESKAGADFEPITATFGTEYCTVYAVVKAGQNIAVQELTADEGSVTASSDDKAISFVAFYCTEEAAQAAADAFPSKGKGGRGRGR